MTQVQQPLVSVVMPSYNHGRFIGRSVQSVLSQTYSNLELIVVDNNSSDNTDEVLGAINDPRLKVLKFSNGGVIAASRNRGIQAAAGAYIAFIDSDDIWLPDKLRKQLAVLLDAPGTVLVYSRFRTLSSETESEEIFPKLSTCADGQVFRQLYLRPFIACSGVLVSKAALAATGGFDESPDLFAAEDMDLWLRIARFGKIRMAGEEPLLLYRVHPGASSSGYFKKYLRAVKLARRHRPAAGYPLFFAALIIALGGVGRAAILDFTGRRAA